MLAALLAASLRLILVIPDVFEPAAQSVAHNWIRQVLQMCKLEACAYHWMRAALDIGLWSPPPGLRMASEGKTEMMLELPSVISTTEQSSALCI